MMIMNENMLNMLKELDSEFPEDFGSYLGVDAIDFEGNDDDYIDFDETFLCELVICYKKQAIAIRRYYENDWEIEDQGYIKSEYFREVGKILSIVMKHLSKIEFK